MERRDFLKGLSAAGLLSIMDPAYLNAKERLQSGQSPTAPVPKRQYGRAKDMISVIGFGGIVVKDVTPGEASNYVSEAVDRGINYFDVAPTYGNAQERLGPALKPYRDRCFLACKTTKRDAKGAREELEESFRLLQTDDFDLYQLHAITTLEDVEQAFAKGGAMETFLKAKEDGKVRYVGFSAHSEVAAHAAMDRYDFDSILFPLSFPIWIKEDFGPSVHKRASKAKRGILAIKAMAHQKWPKSMKREKRPWKKAWYEPFDEIDKVSLGLRFTFHLPAHAMIPPGDWALFKMAVELAQSGALTPLNDDEQEMIRAIAVDSEPIFKKQA
jgi:predicted aldo/keto reductase-like oxidoreductase